MLYKLLELEDGFLVGKLERSIDENSLWFTITFFNKKTKKIKIKRINLKVNEFFRCYLDQYLEEFGISSSNKKEQELTKEEYDLLMNTIYKATEGDIVQIQNEIFSINIINERVSS